MRINVQYGVCAIVCVCVCACLFRGIEASSHLSPHVHTSHEGCAASLDMSE